MPKSYVKASDFIFWHKSLLGIAGLWPLDPRGIKFYIFLIYSTLHLCAAFVDLVQVFGDFSLMVENLGETGLLIMVMAKIPALKCSSSLRNVVKEITMSDDNDNEESYENDEERKIYVSYSYKSLKFFKAACGFSLFATFFFYFKTLLYFLIAEIFGDGPTIYILPYHVRIFINITDLRIYALVCAYQSPMIYVFASHCIISCFMWSLVIHVCGQLSVWAFKIKNVKGTISEKNCERLEATFRQIIQKHKKLIRTSEALDKIFRIFLLDELVICGVVVGLCMYNILVLNANLSDLIVFFCLVMFISAMLTVTYGWCLVGDFLRHESMNVLNAYYECTWYDMPLRCQKLIIICMIRARSPLYISGGGFYIYTLMSFTGVVKSAMAYSSMLRQVI